MITHGKIIEVKATKMKDEPIKGMSVNVITDSVVNEGSHVKLTYTYVVQYNEGVARMEIKGELFAEANSEFGRKLIEGWKKNKMLAPDVAEEVLTGITYAGSASGTLLAYAININAPINVPRTKLMQNPAQPKAG